MHRERLVEQKLELQLTAHAHLVATKDAAMITQVQHPCGSHTHVALTPMWRSHPHGSHTHMALTPTWRSHPHGAHEDWKFSLNTTVQHSVRHSVWQLQSARCLCELSACVPEWPIHSICIFSPNTLLLVLGDRNLALTAADATAASFGVASSKARSTPPTVLSDSKGDSKVNICLPAYQSARLRISLPACVSVCLPAVSRHVDCLCFCSIRASAAPKLALKDAPRLHSLRQAALLIQCSLLLRAPDAAPSLSSSSVGGGTGTGSDAVDINFDPPAANHVTTFIPTALLAQSALLSRSAMCADYL